MKTFVRVVGLFLVITSFALGEILPNGGLEGNMPNYWHPEGTDATLEWGTDAWRTGGHSLKIARSYTAVGDNLYQYGGLEANVPNYWFHEGADAYFEWATDESRTGGHSLKIARFYNATGQSLYPNGGFEAVNPNYWNTGGTSSTADIAWATDESRTGGHSLKIVKTNSDGTAIWQSDDLYRYWSCFVGQNVGMEVGAWVKTQGVNTSPANDDEKIQVIYNFYSAAGVNLLGAPLALDVPQVDANSDGWVEVKSTDLLSFPVTVDSITVSFQFGTNATGTVWMDDAFIRNTTEDEWVGDFFNANVDVPTGWFYWWPDFSYGKADWDTLTPSNMGVTIEYAHTGNQSLKIVESDGENDEVTVNYDITDFVNDGNPLLISAWMKADLPAGMAELANTNGSYAVGFTVTWHDGTGGADGWGEVGGTDYRFTLAGDVTNWTQYTCLLYPPENATQMSVRARYWNFFEGTTYWDDFEVYNTAPATGEVAWNSNDLYRYWSCFVGQNVGMEVGAWVKTQGVNTSPANDDEKIQVIYNFYSAAGVNLLGAPLALDVPQVDANSDGWVEVKSTDPLSFPVTVDSITVSLHYGANAKGIVWMDDAFIRNTTVDEWVGDFFNPNVDVPTGWFYWWPDFSYGKADWDTLTPSNMGVTTEYAHAGNKSLKIVEEDGENDEVTVNYDITDFVNDGNPLLISAWMKADLPAGMAELANTNGSYAVGFTVTWHDGTGGADGWGEVGGTDYRFTLAGDVTDWTQYTCLLYPPENATQLSVRARYWNFFEGTTYWDDFEVYNTAPATGEVAWNSNDLYRYWSCFVGQNVGMEVGSWVKTKSVNTTPANDDEKIQVIYNFYSADGANLLGAPLALDVPQDVANSDGWVEVKSTDPISFPVTADSVTVSFKFGANAKGIAWMDDAFIRNTTVDEWVGDFFNANVDVPTGWFYWWPDFSYGKAAWDTLAPSFMGVTDEEVHTGDYSLKLIEEDGENDEVTVNSDITSFVNDGNCVRVSAWMKADLPAGMADSANTNGSYGVGFTVTWHDGTGGADGWGEVGGTDYRFTLAGDVTDWTYYEFLAEPPENATQLSVRARYWNFFEGITYWDDFKAEQTTIPVGIAPSDNELVITKFKLYNPYPNPFNPSSKIMFEIPETKFTKVSIYDMLGHLVNTLVSEKLEAGIHEVTWFATNSSESNVPTGIYFVQVEHSNRILTKKLVYLK